MNYTKPALSFEEQANQLIIERGLQVDDPQTLVAYLQQVNYYRLSGYWYTFKDIDSKTGKERFKPGTTFELIRSRYEFDRKLRLLLMDAIERIEVAILRTRMVELYTRTYGPFGYADYSNYNPKFSYQQFQKLMEDIKEDEERSYEEFVNRYRSKYTKETYLPLWMVADLMPFGQLLTLFRNLDLSLKQQLAHEFDLFPQVLESWLHTLNYIRNSCAHHARLWNRPLAIKPKLPPKKRDDRWYQPILVNNTYVFVVILFVHYLMKVVAPQDQWKLAFQNLLMECPTIPLNSMGFPTNMNWMDSPIWKL